MLKTCLLSVLTFIVSLSVFAQDKIYKTNGGILEAKVKSVGTNSIIFKRFDNPDGPEYTIPKKEVARIVYQNGVTDFFSKDEPDETKPAKGHKGKMVKKYGSSMISITPAAYTQSLDGTMNDVGVGITYEYLLDNHGRLGLNLPLLVNFTANKDFNNYRYYNGSTANYTGSYHSFFFMPGVKFYPAAANAIIRYSLGASLFWALGTEPRAVYDYNNYYYSGTTPSTDNYHYSMIGLMLSNSVNITATKHLYMAIDLATGIPFSDNRHSSSDQTLGLLLGPFLQFGFKVGYRY